jgi:hypothetical protein
MFLLPYRRFSIETDLPPTEVLTSLRAATEPERWAGSSRTQRPQLPFSGRVTGNSFDLTRSIDYRNSFCPHICGSVEPTTGGARLVGTMKLHDVVAFFMLAFLAITGSLAVAIIPAGLAAGGLESGSLIPLAMFGAGIVMTVGGFAFEAPKSLEALASLVRASRAERQRHPG